MTDLTETTHEFRQHLLSAEAETPALRAEYERRITAMFEKKLSRVKKMWFITLMGFCGVAGALTLHLIITENLPPIARIGLALGVAFCLAWAIFLFRVVRRGSMQLRIDPPMAAGMGFVFALLMCVLFAVGGMPPAYVTMYTALFLIPAGLILLRTVIEQSEMRTQERLVELQYKIARLNERLGGDDDALGSGVLR